MVSCGRVIDTWSRRRGWRDGVEGGRGGGVVERHVRGEWKGNAI